jgi:hypothetical protein
MIALKANDDDSDGDDNEDDDDDDSGNCPLCNVFITPHANYT